MRGWQGHAKVGGGKAGTLRDIRQQVDGQIAVERNDTGIRRLWAAERAILQRLQDRVARRLQRMGIGHGGNQPLGTLDGHINIGGLRRDMHVFGHHAHAPTARQEVDPVMVIANGGQEGRCQIEPAQGHGNVHRHTAGQAGDAARLVRTHAH